MVAELLAVGSAIREWMEALPIRIGVLVSGDLSHTHEASGPYGFSNSSAPFDAAIGTWSKNPCQQASSLLNVARSLQSSAMSCGFVGVVLLHGMLCGHNELKHDSGEDQSPYRYRHDPLNDDRVFVNRNATYYGMLAATFKSRNAEGDGDIAAT